MSLLKTKEALEHALGMTKTWEDEAEMLADKVAEMSHCEHDWDRDTEVLAEMDGRDLSYYEAQCHKCGILKSETF